MLPKLLATLLQPNANLEALDRKQLEEACTTLELAASRQAQSLFDRIFPDDHRKKPDPKRTQFLSRQLWLKWVLINALQIGQGS